MLDLVTCRFCRVFRLYHRGRRSGLGGIAFPENGRFEGRNPKVVLLAVIPAEKSLALFSIETNRWRC